MATYFVTSRVTILTVTKLYYFVITHNLAGASGHVSTVVLASLRATCLRRFDHHRRHIGVFFVRSRNKNGTPLKGAHFCARDLTGNRILRILCSVWIVCFVTLTNYLKALFDSPVTVPQTLYSWDHATKTASTKSECSFLYA